MAKFVSLKDAIAEYLHDDNEEYHEQRLYL